MANKIKWPVVNGQKECAACRLWKPVECFSKARRHYTVSCKSCRKIYAAEYRKRPEVKEKSRAYVVAYRSIPDNRKRINENGKRHRKKPLAKAKRNASRRAWTLKEKRKAVDYKGGKCEICGYNRCLAAMEFHHRDPRKKDGYGTGALKAHWTFEKNKAEIDKCNLVCVRCHREIHTGLHPQYLEGGSQ